MSKYEWAKLNGIQVGRYAEYIAKMEFTMYGFDVYTAEVDDHGIDFVIRKDPATYYDVQVKSVRGHNYIFFQKSKFDLRDNMLAVVVLFTEGFPPDLFIIPAETWNNPCGPFKDREYEGKKSAPEWGLQLSVKDMAAMESFRFDNMIQKLLS